MLIYGINPTSEALRTRTASKVWISSRKDRRIERLLELAARAGVEVERVDKIELDRLTRGGTHQGVVARLTKLDQRSVTELIERARVAPLIVVVDGVEDPQNFGALLRTADAAGADGVVYQTRRAAPISGATAKASAGAIAHLPLAPVTNISRAIAELKSGGVWVVGLDSEADQAFHEAEYTQPTALVVGAEGKGLRRLVRDRCDWLVSIPMRGGVSSLNVSVAAGVVLYEALRQRSLSRA